MGKKGKPDKAVATPSARPSALLDTGGQALSGRVIYCGDCLEQLLTRPLPLTPRPLNLVYIDPSFNSNRRHTSTTLAEERKNAHASL
jgi:hypothetical protein